MNLAALAQSQTLATLLQALNPATGLPVAGTVEARLLALAGDGTATAQLGNAAISLVLAGPEARQAALVPGAMLLLKIAPPEEPGAPLRATLLDVRPPTPSSTPLPSSSSSAGPALTSAPAPAPVQIPSPIISQQEDAPAKLHPPGPAQPGQSTDNPPPARPGAAPSIAAAPLSARAAAAPTAAIGATSPLPGVLPPPATAPVVTAAAARAMAGPLLGATLANQDSLAPLLANLRGVAEGTVSFLVPRPLLKLADQVLAQALPVERRAVTSESLKQAIQRSGLFMEARQGTSQPPLPQTDLKAGLIALRTALEPMIAMLGGAPTGKRSPAEPPSDPLNQASRAAPPRRDGPLALQPIAEPTLAAGEKPLAIAETLLKQTDAALDRITLSQYASLPLEGARSEAAQAQRWFTEIPLAFQTGTAMLPLQVEREPPKRGPTGVEAQLWRVRFALDVEPMGPLQGVVTLQGRSVGVTLWAEREETSRLLRGAAPGLEAALIDAQFENGAIDIHTGQPRFMQATAGQFLDRLS